MAARRVPSARKRLARVRTVP
ncbi:MAG: hypothetical protein RJA51_1761, partial [Actinomycetota bacterium]